MSLSNKHITTFLLTFFLGCTYIPTKAQDSTAADHFKKGEYFFNNADYEEAANSFDKSVKLDGQNQNTYLKLGFCHNLLGQYEKAIDDFSKVIQLNPNHSWAYVSRGSARNKVGQYDLAISDFNKALEFDPKDQEAYNNRGFAKKLSGDLDGACKDWQTSKKLGNKEAVIILKNNHCK